MIWTLHWAVLFVNGIFFVKDSVLVLFADDGVERFNLSKVCHSVSTFDFLSYSGSQQLLFDGFTQMLSVVCITD